MSTLSLDRHRTSRVLPRALAALTCLAAVFGCAPDRGPGSLDVSYVLGNHKTCAELGVERVVVSIYTGTVDDMPEYEDDSACVSDGEVSIPDIEPGLYTVEVTGYDAAGVAILDNLGSTATERRVEIFEAAETPFDTDLTARPAQLDIAWRLGEGGFANCGSLGIDRFEITAYQVGGSTILLEAELDCELSGNAMGYRAVPDPDRRLNGTLFGEVGIQPIDTSGAPVGDPAGFAFAPPGDGYPIQLRIECTDVECYEQP